MLNAGHSILLRISPGTDLYP